MSMNTRQARVVDPVLTKVAQGYKNAQFVGGLLFPPVPVEARGGRILEFGKEGFRLYNARRAPGAATLTIPFAYEGKPYELLQDALNVSMPRELIQEAQNGPGVELGTRATGKAMQSLTLTLEHEQAAIATNPASFAASNKVVLSGSSKWSDQSSTPEQDVKAAKEQVRRTAGIEPNVAIVSSPAFNALTMHPKVMERFKYTSSDSITAAMLAAFFNLDRLAVGKATALKDSAPNAPFEDVWGNAFVMGYAPLVSVGAEEPSFGYTYTLTGHPFTEAAYWDNDRKSWVYGVTYERAPVLTGIASGFLFQNVVE